MQTTVRKHASGHHSEGYPDQSICRVTCPTPVLNSFASRAGADNGTMALGEPSIAQPSPKLFINLNASSNSFWLWQTRVGGHPPAPSVLTEEQPTLPDK